MKMRDVDQTHPDTNRAFGFAVYASELVADGGREASEQTMADVEHEPPTDGARRSFERGRLEDDHD